MLDVTAKLSVDIQPGSSRNPFQPHLVSNRPGVRWGEAEPLPEGLVHHIQRATFSSSNDSEWWHKQEDKTQQQGKNVEIKFSDLLLSN